MHFIHVFYFPVQVFESIDQMTQHIMINIVGQSSLWSPEAQDMNIFGMVEGQIRIRAVKIR
jgi:hypothetical protein